MWKCVKGVTALLLEALDAAVCVVKQRFRTVIESKWCYFAYPSLFRNCKVTKINK